MRCQTFVYLIPYGTDRAKGIPGILENHTYFRPPDQTHPAFRYFRKILSCKPDISLRHHPALSQDPQRRTDQRALSGTRFSHNTQNFSRTEGKADIPDSRSAVITD